MSIRCYYSFAIELILIYVFWRIFGLSNFSSRWRENVSGLYFLYFLGAVILLVCCIVMLDHKRLLRDLKEKIKKILSKTGTPISVDELYGSLICEIGFFPHSSLGYTSFHCFLEAIPDTVSLEVCSETGTTMVKMAKMTNGCSLAPSSNGAVYVSDCPSSDTLSEYRSDESVSGGSGRWRSRSSSRGQPKLRSIYIPPSLRFKNLSSSIQESILSTLKEKARKVIEPCHDGISLSGFLGEYKRQYGKLFDFQEYGFSSLKECFESVPGLQVVVQNGSYLVCSTSASRPAKATGTIADTSSWGEKIDSYESDESVTFLYSYEKSSRGPTASKALKQSKMTNFVETTCKPHPPASSGAEASATPKKPPTGLFPKSLDHHQPAASTSDDVPASTSDDVRVEPSTTGAETVASSGWQKVREILMPKKPEEAAPKVGLDIVAKMDKVTRNTRQLLKAHLGGIPLTEFYHAYLLNYDTQFAPQDLHFFNVESMLLNIAADVPLTIDYTTDQAMVRLDFDTLSAFPQVELTSAGIPVDAALSDAKYEEQQIITWSENTFFPVYIAEIYTPDYMYIHLKGSNTSIALAELQQRLQNFYSSKAADAYTMKNEHILKDVVCACPWTDGEWYRAVVTHVEADTSCVRIVYADYGTKGRAQKCYMKYLKNEFLALPSQGIRARMAFLKPSPGIEGYWNIRDRERLLEICIGRELMAQVSRNTAYSVLSLWFCDCSTGNTIYLSKRLVEEGLATYNREEIQRTPSIACFSDPEKLLFHTGLFALEGPNRLLSNVQSGSQNAQGGSGAVNDWEQRKKLAVMENLSNILTAIRDIKLMS